MIRFLVGLFAIIGAAAIVAILLTSAHRLEKCRDAFAEVYCMENNDNEDCMKWKER